MLSALRMKPLLKRIGFHHIVQIEYEAPLNQWVPDPEMKRLGDLGSKLMLQSLLPLTRSTVGAGLGYGAQEIDILLEGVRRDVLDTRVQVYMSV